MVEPRRILVAGSSGFTGQPLLAKLLERGHVAQGLTRTPINEAEVFADLEDRASVERLLGEFRPEIVVHLAGISSPTHSDLSELYKSNIIGTLNLLQALAEAPLSLRLVIVASSATVYRTGGDALIDEDAELGPASHYAISKRCVEDIAAQFQSRLPIRIVRPFNYTGPGQGAAFFVPKVVGQFARRAPVLEVGNLELVRDISAIGDVVETYVRLVEGGVAGAPLNICSGHGVRLSDIVERTSALSGHTLEVRRNPAFMRQGEPISIIGSRTRLDEAIGAWERVRLDDLLRQMLDAMRGAGEPGTG